MSERGTPSSEVDADAFSQVKSLPKKQQLDFRKTFHTETCQGIAANTGSQSVTAQPSPTLPPHSDCPPVVREPTSTLTITVPQVTAFQPDGSLEHAANSRHASVPHLPPKHQNLQNQVFSTPIGPVFANTRDPHHVQLTDLPYEAGNPNLHEDPLYLQGYNHATSSNVHHPQVIELSSNSAQDSFSTNDPQFEWYTSSKPRPDSPAEGYTGYTKKLYTLLNALEGSGIMTHHDGQKFLYHFTGRPSAPP